MSPLLINEPPLQVLPSLAVAIGLNEAIVLQQIHYWEARSDKVIDGERWVFNTLPAWTEQFPFWSEDTVARTLKRLRDKGLVIAKSLGPTPTDRTLYYRINREALERLNTATCGDRKPQLAGMEDRNLQGSIKEKTEITYREESTDVDSPPPLSPSSTSTAKKRFRPEDYPIPDWLPSASWAEWCQHRREIRHPLTELSCQKTVKTLTEIRESGGDWQASIDRAITNRWRGIFPEKPRSTTYAKPNWRDAIYQNDPWPSLDEV